ncbi:MAG TPA: glycosyltransferase family 4 protein [Ignavibacteria bacterium]|nr:glycosyltransferase family 4 protein [Ignavibacteria bacterium]HQY52564.1 glycosyltransferase family 4 protein [Ignavibacteria bacterium]
MVQRILHLSPDVGFNDGRSYYVFLLLKYLKRNGQKVFLCTNNTESRERILRYGAGFISIDTLSDKKKILNSISALSKIVKENKIEIIHSHHRYYEFLANAVRLKTGVKTVFTALSIVDKRYFVEYKSDRLIAVSSYVKRMMVNSFGIEKERIQIIPNFTDSEEITDNVDHDNESTEFLNIINDKKNKGYKILLSVGRYHKDKDHFTLLKALTQLKEKKIFTVIIGSGDLKTEYEKFIKENDLNVLLVPAQKDLGKYYIAADICVLCSVKEPLPGFMLQSGLFKKPFIGSDTDGIKEVIINNENGLIFKKRNYTELKDCIMMLTESSELPIALSEKLHYLIIKDFTEKKTIPEIEMVYRSLIN